MSPGEDVIIDWEGEEHFGHVDRIDHGWAFCTMAIDPDLDYGSGTERLSPYQSVCVPVARVRSA